MTVSIWMKDEQNEEATPRRKLEADLVIVGAGLLGAASAYFARQFGGAEKRIILVDAGKLGGAASGRNAGFVLRGIHTYYDSCISLYGRESARRIYRMGEENQALIRQFAAENAVDIEEVEGGSYILASSLEELDRLSQSAKFMQEDGFELTLHTQDPLDRGFYGAIFNPGDFGINPVKLVRALVAAAGVTVLEEEALLNFEHGAPHILETSGAQIQAKRLLFCTNAYLPLILPGFLDHLRPARGQMFSTAPLKKKLLDKLCYANYGFEYFRQLPDHRLLLGGARQLFLDEESGYGEAVTARVQNTLEDYLKDHFPEAAGVAIERRWSGIMAFTEDGLPYLGELPKQPGVYCAVGCNGHGLGWSMTLGRLAASITQGGQAAEKAMENKDLAYFSLKRMAQFEKENKMKPSPKATASRLQALTEG